MSTPARAATGQCFRGRDNRRWRWWATLLAAVAVAVLLAVAVTAVAVLAPASDQERP
jgi:hypothetical protein